MKGKLLFAAIMLLLMFVGSVHAEIINPVVYAPDQTVNEGTMVTSSGSFTDSDPAEIHTATIDWGDGTASEASSVTESGGRGTISGNHVYADNGIYIATLTVNDNNGGIETDSFTVTVHNLPPNVEAGSDQTVDLGLVSTDLMG